MTFEVPPRVATGLGGMAVTPHELATQAALETMALGGNAVDAAVAANAVLGVVLPDTCGIGGDLFALVHRPGERRPRALNASGRAGSGADAEALRAAGHVVIPPLSPHSVTIPGCIDGWEALLTKLGTMPLGDVLAPAMRHADGFPTSPELSRTLLRLQSDLQSQPSGSELFPGQAAPLPGERLTRPALKVVLDDVGRGGRTAFYEGAAGAYITEVTGGVIEGKDLERRQADWVEPASLDVFGKTAFTIPPNSQGYLALAAAWIASHLSPEPDALDPERLHVLIEAYRSVAWERDDVVADQDFAPHRVSQLLDTERLRQRAGEVDTKAARRWPTPAAQPAGTAYLCFIDRAGMGVSLIQSNFSGIGSRISAGDTGVWLHNRGEGFSLQPGHPNELGPGKRPLHTLSPTLWLDGTRLDTLLGTRGGHQQPQFLLQMATHLFLDELGPGAAQAVPRWAISDFGTGTSSEIVVESRMPPSTVDGLRAKGHDIATGAAWEPGFGPVSLIRVDDRGVRAGAADPRITTATAAAR